MSGSLSHRCVVGEGFAVGHVVGSLDELDVESLRSLDGAIVGAQHVMASVFACHVAQRIGDGHYGHGGSMLTGSLIGAGYDVNGDEGTHAVVNAHHTGGVIRNSGDAVLA